MTVIAPLNSECFTVNGIPKQRGQYELVTDASVSLVGIRPVGQNAWVDGCNMQPVQAYCDHTNMPFSSVAALLSYVQGFMFYSGGGSSSSSSLTLSPGTLAGRGTGSGAGAPEQITLGSGLVMTGTTLSVSSEPPNGMITPGMPLDFNTSFNDYVANFNSNSSFGANTGGYGLFSFYCNYIGNCVPNPSNATGVYQVRSEYFWDMMWYGLIYQYFPLFEGYLSEKRNFYILKRRMRMVNFPADTSYHYGVFPVYYLYDQSYSPYYGVFFRWETDGSDVINFRTHVRNGSVSTISVPTYRPPNWDDWFVLEIRIDALGIQFFVDGISVTGHINTNIPYIDTYFGSDIYGIIGFVRGYHYGGLIEVDWDYARPNV